MGIVVYSLLWVMQDVYHQPYCSTPPKNLETGLRTIRAGSPYILLLRIEALGCPAFGLLLYTATPITSGL